MSIFSLIVLLTPLSSSSSRSMAMCTGQARITSTNYSSMICTSRSTHRQDHILLVAHSQGNSSSTWASVDLVFKGCQCADHAVRRGALAGDVHVNHLAGIVLHGGRGGAGQG